MAFTKEEFQSRAFSAGELKSRWDQLAATTVFLKLEEPCPSDHHYREVAFDFLDKISPPVAGKRVLKLDLMNEAANTNYIEWFGQRGAHVFGVDISEMITRRAAHKTANLGRFVNGDIRGLPFADASLDVVFSFGTMEHVKDHASVVQEIMRVLKPGGYALCSLCNTRSVFLNKYLWDLLDLLQLSKDDNSFEASFPPYHLTEMFRAAGGVEISIISGGYFPRFWRCFDLWTASKAGSPVFKLVNAVKRPLFWPIFALSSLMDRRCPAQYAEIVMTVARKPC